MRLFHVKTRDRPPRTADEVQRLSVDGTQHIGAPDPALDRVGDRLAVVAQLRKAQSAKRKADAAADNRLIAGAVHPDQLDTAAAEIGDDPIGVGYPGEDSRGGQLGLLAAIDDPDRHAAPLFDLGGEGAAIARLANRRGGDDRQMIDRQGASQRDETLQIVMRQFDADRVQATTAADPAPQAAHDLFVEHRHQCRAEPLVDDEAQ